MHLHTHLHTNSCTQKIIGRVDQAGVVEVRDFYIDDDPSTCPNDGLCLVTTTRRAPLLSMRVHHKALPSPFLTPPTPSLAGHVAGWAGQRTLLEWVAERGQGRFSPPPPALPRLLELNEVLCFRA